VAPGGDGQEHFHPAPTMVVIELEDDDDAADLYGQKHRLPTAIRASGARGACFKSVGGFGVRDPIFWPGSASEDIRAGSVAPEASSGCTGSAAKDP
jgi:hypothetical protein